MLDRYVVLIMYVERDIQPEFRRRSAVNDMVAIVGPRQAGKTTFLLNQTPSDASYVLFDDPMTRTLFEDNFKDFEVQYVKDRSITVLDEVQYCREAGTRLKYLVDTGNRLWASSSSEILLGQEVLSYLVGRVSILRLHPFNLREFLRAKGQRVLPPDIQEQFVWEHMAYGGYPRVVLTDHAGDKASMLSDLHTTMVLRDMVRTFSIQDIRDLEWLSVYLAQSPGALVSYEDLASVMGKSRITVKKYLDAMEKSYLIHLIRPFFTNRRKELVARNRIYFVDTGLRNAVAKDLKDLAQGPVFENYVLTELVKMGFSPKYWRTKAKAEVDFVIEKDRAPVPVEAKLNLNPRKVERGLRSFIAQYGPKEAYVVGYKGDLGSVDVEGCDVDFIHVSGLYEALHASRVTDGPEE